MQRGRALPARARPSRTLIFAYGENANESLPAYAAHRTAKERIATSLRSSQWHAFHFLCAKVLDITVFSLKAGLVRVFAAKNFPKTPRHKIPPFLCHDTGLGTPDHSLNRSFFTIILFISFWISKIRIQMTSHEFIFTFLIWIQVMKYEFISRM